MALALATIGWCVFTMLVLVGLGLNTVGLFGNWIILAALAGAWVAYDFVPFGWVGVTLIVGFAVLGEVLEFALAAVGAKKFGGSTGAMWAALVGAIGGAIVGSPLLPIIGTVIGACVGAFGAAAAYQYLKHGSSVEDSLRVGTGAAVGKMGGIVAKFSCGLLMLVTAYVTW